MGRAGSAQCPEAVAAILREMRGEGGGDVAGRMFREYADRIEAAVSAHCRNAAAMREALESVVKYLGGIVPTRREIDLVKSARAALAAPPRNCDVGTAEEQQNRFREFCRHYDSEGECGIGRSEAACPAFHGWRNPDCSLWWAQMPYEEGGDHA